MLAIILWACSLLPSPSPPPPSSSQLSSRSWPLWPWGSPGTSPPSPRLSWWSSAWPIGCSSPSLSTLVWPYGGASTAWLLYAVCGSYLKWFGLNINTSSALGPQSSTWQNITSTLRWQKLAPQKVKWGNLIEWICDRCHLYLWSLDLLKFMFIEPPVQRIVIKAITMYCKGALEEEENFFKFLYLLSLCRCAEFSSQSSSFSVDCDVTSAITWIPS